MDHSRVAYLMGPAGQPIAMLPLDSAAGGGAQASADMLAQWVR